MKKYYIGEGAGIDIIKNSPYHEVWHWFRMFMQIVFILIIAIIFAAII